ncbi:hypothetical protein [Goodfellowiella coeruleoviolacea]|uniref:Helix-turn-helix domain-containing protein n=1 Tax=Goodfellowiella coeruleoviolacea TaxID=334858 RepID=A0AAE3GH17_9PSEU|nr:hypothetical protein [Goodfellowiella coeruleoviolacea]MCP2168107.1 Helix-turn-helix domain-containing protein [Goodfellowiella coeruleoviolacea]
MSKYEPGMQLLAEVVRRRRERLGITQEDVAEKYGGPSVASMHTIENGLAKSFRSKTLFSLDNALSWIKGTATCLIEGGTPSACFAPNYDDFVEDAINRVSEFVNEKYDRLVGDTSAPPPEEEKQLPTVIGVRHGMLKPMETLSVWGRLSDPASMLPPRSIVTVDQLIRHVLPGLTIEELEKLSVAAMATAEAKHIEREKSIGLPDPSRIAAVDEPDPDAPEEVAEAWAELMGREMEYQATYNWLKAALDKRLDVEAKYHSRTTGHLRAMVASARASYERAEMRAREALVEAEAAHRAYKEAVQRMTGDEHGVD